MLTGIASALHSTNRSSTFVFSKRRKKDEKSVFALVVGGLLLVSCGKTGPQGPYDPEDEVVIHGVYLNEGGDPFADRWVGYWINSPESFFTNFLGLDPEASDMTDAQGEYEETFMGGDLMNESGATYEVIVMNYDPGWPDTTPRVASLFFPLDKDITVPTMQLWRGNPVVTMNVNTAEFNWARLSTTHGSEPDRYKFQVKATQDGPYYTLWQEEMGSDTSFTLPGYVIPEAYGRKWRVLAEIDRPSDSENGFVYASDPDTTEIPDDPYQLLSLGKNCFAEAYADPFSKATDGKWGPWPTYCAVITATNVSWIYVDLSDTTQTVNAVVMYDMSISGTPSTPGFEVYCSNDTTSWGTAVTSNSARDGYFYIDGFSEQCRT
jgi:hypothetical protein